MITCPTCKQTLGEEVAVCPACSAELTSHRTAVNGYRLIKVLREGYASTLFRGRKACEDKDVLLRVFKPEAAIDEAKAARLRDELDKLAQLPSPRLVKHRELARDEDGTWYRVSEWVEVVGWGYLIASRFFQQPRGEKQVLSLFIEMASAVADLHQHGLIIPFLTTDDILIYRDAAGGLAVKIDYKLSRTLDPDLAHPPLMLRKLIEQHPDCLEKRALDMRSDIWSLGKIFTELLAGSDDLTDLVAAVEKLTWHRKVKVLLRQMIEDDPALRVNSMTRVIKLLSEVTEEDLVKAKAHFTELNKSPLRQTRRLTRLVTATFFVLLLVLGGAIFMQRRYQYFFRDETATLVAHADQYTSSVAYVVVQYWLAVDGEKKYMNISEGTAFLVDAAGYLLTNRHVACPWLEDSNFAKAIKELQDEKKTPEFGYAMALWFDGRKALKKARENAGKATMLQDFFYLDSAYRSDSIPAVKIAGVLNPLQGKRYQIELPLGNDVAVLKIDQPPAGVVPLPINSESQDAASPKRPAVAVIGFPLGSSSNMDSVIRSSVTFGHVRRTFASVIQADVSMHPGNSGGPVLDVDGRVVGIASAVANQGGGLFTEAQSDFGLILPIAKAFELLQDIKSNHLKWDGVIDPQQPKKVAEMFLLAEKGNWAAAQSLVDDALQTSRDPNIFMVGGLIHLAAGAPETGRVLFGKSIAIEPDNGLAKFFAYLCDRELGHAMENPWRQELLQLDWRSPFEFYGYLVKVLEKKIEGDEALNTGENQTEQSQLLYALARVNLSRENYEEAETLLEKAMIKVDRMDFFSILIRSELKKVQVMHELRIDDEVSRRKYHKRVVAFWLNLQIQSDKTAEKIAELKQKIAAISSQEAEKETDQQSKYVMTIKLYQKLKELDPEDTTANITLAFYLALEGKWDESLAYADDYLNTPGRASSNRLGMGLLRCQLLLAAGRPEESDQALRAFADQVTDPWYRTIAKTLLGELSPEKVQGQAQSSPQSMVTLYTALGFQAESLGETEAAVNYYSLALESYLDTWLEYTFAKTRIQQLRR